MSGSPRGRIAFVILPGEKGHLNPAACLARRLLDAGYDVSFVGLADDRQALVEQGFQYVTVAEEVWPAGRLAELAEGPTGVFGLGRIWKSTRAARALLKSIARSPVLGGFDLVLSDGLSPLGTLICASATSRVAVLQIVFSLANPALPHWESACIPATDGSFGWRYHLGRWWVWFASSGRRFASALAARAMGIGDRDLLRLFGLLGRYRRVKDVARSYPNLIACPRDLDFPSSPPANEHYIDGLVERRRATEPFDLGAAAGEMVLVAMGSQPARMRKPMRFYSTVLAAAQRMPERCFVIAAGRFAERLQSAAAAIPNVRLHAWIPQQAALAKASVFITHAGINGLKEAIYAGVPVICLPIDRDQPGNAARVHYHRLGVRADYRKITTAELAAHIGTVLGDPSYRARVQAMRARFVEADERGDALRIIDELVRGGSA